MVDNLEDLLKQQVSGKAGADERHFSLTHTDSIPRLLLGVAWEWDNHIILQEPMTHKDVILLVVEDSSIIVDGEGHGADCGDAGVPLQLILHLQD